MHTWVRIGVALLLLAGCDSVTPAPAPAAPSATRVGVSPVPPAVAVLPVPTGPVTLEQCPVTEGSDSAEPQPAPSDLPAMFGNWHGSGPLWVSLFDFRSNMDHRQADGYVFKLPWKALVEGTLDVDVRRIDAQGKGRGRAQLAFTEKDTFFAGDVWVPGTGCWLVVGTLTKGTVDRPLDRVSLGFVFRV